MKDFCVSFPCCHPESCIPGLRGGVRLEEPAAGNLHGGVCEGGESWEATVNLNGHETGNGGNSQGEPTASRDLLYSESQALASAQLLPVLPAAAPLDGRQPG